ncbi:MAG: chemotaxis response regulator protein-glutamate methylesterase [Magnetococcales bacterium]|nr:chemotaxis response regulator protein-glutamate methylesterase [Magnetococcales bacterium]
MKQKHLRVLIIVNAPGMRRALVEIVEADPLLEVAGAVADPLLAAKRIANEVPDAILLEMETPRLSGLSFLKKLMNQCPVPVVALSTQAREGWPSLTAAQNAGAMDVIELPETEARDHLLAISNTIRDKIKSAARHRLNGNHALPSLTVQPKLTADALLPPPPRWAKVRQTEKVICMGASTGGTDSLPTVLEKIPSDCPGIVIVQHMPEGFTATFAQRLDALCKISVKEAQHGDVVVPGRALIAPGNRHLLLARRTDHYVVELKDGPLVTRHRPSVDVLFRSAARSAGGNAIGVLMTGMGDDGARGLLEMRQAGAITMAEHESSCVVYGMPKEAIERGAAEFIVPLPRIVDKISDVLKKSQK